MASLKTYDITLEDGSTLRLRLTSRALSNFIKAHGLNGASPLVSVLSAVNSIEAQIALFTAALKCDPHNAIQDGAELIDTLNDEGKGDAYLRGLITYLAEGCGLLTRDQLPEMLDSMLRDSEETISKLGAILRHETAGSDQAGSTAEAAENPT